MLAIFNADAGTFDVFALIAAVIFVVAAFLARPASGSPTNAYAATVGYMAGAVFAFGFLFLTA